MFFVEGGGKEGRKKSFLRTSHGALLTGPPNFHSRILPSSFNTPFPILVIPAMEEAWIDEERFKLIRDRSDLR